MDHRFLLQHFLAISAKAHPDKAAVEVAGRRCTYTELQRRAGLIAGSLQARGVRRGDLVAVWMEKSPETVATFFGILTAGAAYVPINANTPSKRVAAIVRQARARLMVVDQSPVGDDFAGQESPIVTQAQLEGQGRPPTVVAGLEGDLAYVHFTSGSTGTPKGVAISHRAAVAYYDICDEILQGGPGDLVANHAPLSFDLSSFDIHFAIRSGATLSMLTTEVVLSPDAFLRFFTDTRPTVLYTVPSTLNALAGLNAIQQLRVPSLRHLIFAGEPPNSAALRKLRPVFPNATFHHWYGSTEAALVTAVAFAPGADLPEVLPLGSAVPNVALAVLKEDGEVCAPGLAITGELQVASSVLFEGYYGDAATSEAAFRLVEPPGLPARKVRWFRTRDLVRCLPGGSLEYLGRVDHMVKIRGFRVELGEVEAALLAQPSVRETVVLAREDVPGDKRLVAYVVGDPAQVPSEAVLRKALSASLAEYMVPAAIVALPVFPLTPNGKIDRKALPAPHWGADSSAYVAPRSETEKVLAVLWGEVLGLKRVGIEEDFVSLGGHSLLAVKLLSKVCDAFKVALPFRAIFEAGTVAGMAVRIEAGAAAGPPTRAEGVSAFQVSPSADSRTHTELPLSFMEERQFRWWNASQDTVPERVVRMALVLDGPVNVEALRKALALVVERHELLRSTYTLNDDTVTRRVNDAAKPQLALVDAREMSEPEALDSLRAEFLARRFELSQEPPLRLVLGRLAEHRHILLMVMDHIAADAEGQRLIWTELKSYYAAFAKGEVVEVVAPLIQYSDFALWQRRLFADPAVLEPERAFWRGRLDEVVPITRLLATDFPREPVDAIRSTMYLTPLPVKRVSWEDPPGLAASLEGVARRKNAGLFAAKFAAYAAVLGARAGANEVVVSNLSDYRLRVLGLEGVVGSFLNPALLRLSLAGNPTWVELIGRAQADLVEVASRVEFPLIPLVYPKLNDFFRVVFNFLPAGGSAGGPDWPGCQAQTLSMHPLRLADEKHPLDLVMVVGRDGGTLIYNTQLWSPETAQSMVDQYLQTLSLMAADPEGRPGQTTRESTRP